MLGETPPGSRPASQPGDPDMNDAMFPLKNPPKSKEGWSARADPTDIDTGGRCKSCKKCCHRVLKFFGHDPNAANKYAWVESDFESANLKNKGVRCKALETYPNPASKDPTLREALPHDLHFTKDAVIIIIERPAEPGVLWRGYLETDEKKLDGNINPLLVDMDGVQQHRERPLDLSESDDEEDAEVEAQFIALDKEVRENAKEVNAQLTGEGGVKLEDLWGAEEEDTTLNHKDKDAILKLKEKIEVRDVYAAQRPPLGLSCSVLPNHRFVETSQRSECVFKMLIGVGWAQGAGEAEEREQAAARRAQQVHVAVDLPERPHLHRAQGLGGDRALDPARRAAGARSAAAAGGDLAAGGPQARRCHRAA